MDGLSSLLKTINSRRYLIAAAEAVALVAVALAAHGTYPPTNSPVTDSILYFLFGLLAGGAVRGFRLYVRKAMSDKDFDYSPGILKVMVTVLSIIFAEDAVVIGMLFFVASVALVAADVVMLLASTKWLAAAFLAPGGYLLGSLGANPD